MLNTKANGGEGGIRTPDTLSGMPVFKTGAINHSANSPELLLYYTEPEKPREAIYGIKWNARE